MPKKTTIKPLFISTDKSYSEIKPFESPFIKGLSFDQGNNPVSGIGSNNPSGEGQNELMQHTIRSNVAVPDVLLPTGYNKNIGSFESITTRELYHFNYNINGNHGIYVLSGNTGLWQKVIEDPELQFTDDQEGFIANHRVLLRFVKDASGNIIEKYLLLTDGKTWQKYISVIAAIQTNGFDEVLYPYWVTKQPHFDRRELVEWAVRPPMIKPVVEPLDNTDADKGKINRFADKGLQVAYAYENTDGRPTTLSPYSLPILIKTEDYLSSPDNVPKNVRATLAAGSPITEKINVYVRAAKKGVNTLPSISEWTDWKLYDTLKKFPNPNATNVLATEYWLRTNPWANYSYDTVFNTIQYTLDLSKVQQIIDQEFANSPETNMPQLSVGMTDVGDAALLVNNRYGYPNFGEDVLSKLSAEVVEKPNSACTINKRNIRLYAYIGRMGDDFSWTSQVGYTNGEDKTVRWGGLTLGKTGVAASIDMDESKAFGLDFAGKSGFRCYLKGRAEYADGVWYKVDSGNNLTKLPATPDFSVASDLQEVQNTFLEQGYYVCVFDITAPAGKYIATLGRHNVASSGDYRNTSTYIYGIANSRVKSQSQIVIVRSGGSATHTPITVIKPEAINNSNGILYSKEMEVDCSAVDVDVWGNGSDLFYIYCPHMHMDGHIDLLNIRGDHWRFTEGYLKEAANDLVPVELFPYDMNHGGAYRSGMLTDKNGFYWAYTQHKNATSQDIAFTAKMNCAYPAQFTIATSSTGIGWKVNPVAYLSDHWSNGGVNDRILLFGKITNFAGTVGYSNIAISIKDGATVYTKTDGTFTLIIHNGQNVNRISNVYVNAGGNFSISIENCGQPPLFNFSEALAPCLPLPIPTGVVRSYPIELTLAVMVSTERQTSLKENGKYSVVVYGADLAGRLMYANEISEIQVPSFLLRANLAATFLRLLINNSINFANYPDIKWITAGVSKNIGIKRYLQWVGDGISYIDNNGLPVNDPANAVFVSIKINSLYNSNISKNFDLLSTYEFVKGDRVRILDNGTNLLDVATYGEEINLQILGTNYSQVAIESGKFLPQTDPITNVTTTTDVALIVRYDSRLDKLIDKVGFWIEIYTPTEESDIIPYLEVPGFYPIISNAIAEFIGFSGGSPAYNYLTSIDLEFWDTYFFDRNITIPNVGNRFIGHPFESPNVTDNWGADINSGGKPWIKNENAKQYWEAGGTTKSDNFSKDGLVNGLNIFRLGNKKDFGAFPFGGIICVHSETSIIAFICENNWFTTDYNLHNAYLNEQGILVANLDAGLSTPHQKIGSQFGLSKADTGTVIIYDKEIYWYDRKNAGYIRMNYRDAWDTTIKSESEQGGMQSYFNAKTNLITTWNNAEGKENSFDAIAGVDIALGKIYITFRCRRNNSNELSSYINNRRNWQVNFQETIVYDTINRGWLRTEGFTPEGYGAVRGDATGMQLVTMAAGKPYLHSSNTTSFNEYYGIQTIPVCMGVINEENGIAKCFENILYNGNPAKWRIDYMFTDFPNSFSYLNTNKFKKYSNIFYAAIERNMNSYPSQMPEDLFRSMLFDGYRMAAKYLVFRLLGNYENLSEYKELGEISCVTSLEDSNIKA